MTVVRCYGQTRVAAVLGYGEGRGRQWLFCTGATIIRILCFSAPAKTDGIYVPGCIVQFFNPFIRSSAGVCSIHCTLIYVIWYAPACSFCCHVHLHGGGLFCVIACGLPTLTTFPPEPCPIVYLVCSFVGVVLLTFCSSLPLFATAFLPLFSVHPCGRVYG